MYKVDVGEHIFYRARIVLLLHASPATQPNPAYRTAKTSLRDHDHRGIPVEQRRHRFIPLMIPSWPFFVAVRGRGGRWTRGPSDVGCGESPWR